ncbi:MAG: ABC transporter permease [Dysgonamonadaceae bacterium]|jgi:ABC-type lipoprotein release transport system permease subunit|nr:ABC transporter permease [Dysgonamonadaceae bacterium]
MSSNISLFIRLAIRNVYRNANATILNGIGISCSIILVLFILSLSKGIETQMILRNINFETGAITVDINKDLASVKNKEYGDSIFKLIQWHYDYHPRIYTSHSSLYFEGNNQRVAIIGLTKSEEDNLKQHIKILSGDIDLSNGSNEILISNGLSESLNLKVGDNCEILQHTVDGAINIGEYLVSGIFRYTSQMNKNTIYLNYEQTKQLYNCNLPTKIVITLKDLSDVDNIKNLIKNQLNELTHNADFFNVSTYKDNLNTAQTLAKLNKYGMLSIAVFLILISFIGIWSMQVENIRKRKLEIGTMSALGFSSVSIKSIFIYESVYIGVCFSIVGIIIFGVILFIFYLNDGIYLGNSLSFVFGSSIIHLKLTTIDLTSTLTFSVIYPILATMASISSANNNTIQLLKEND